ncbi:MAG: N-acetylmuramoyl-L-alanine amidase [Wenzhouxiangella sp.]|nr:N-acetylmuramoyl-L-alanine amidase [Wenzhouxiangella sp.]
MNGKPTEWLDGPQREPLSYQNRLDQRSLDDIDLIVIHATELPDLSTARQYGEKIHYPVSQTGNSGHFYIDRDGRIEQWVALDRIAHHVAGYNAHSIGIELVNLGRYPDWLDSRHQTWQEDVSPDQITALIELIQQLQRAFPALTKIAGHDQLDLRFIPASDDAGKNVRRKLDPGPNFPWDQVIEATGLSVFERP